MHPSGKEPIENTSKEEAKLRGDWTDYLSQSNGLIRFVAARVGSLRLPIGARGDISCMPPPCGSRYTEQ